MCTDTSSNENNTLDPATNPKPFCLGPLLHPSSLTGAPHHPPNRSDVLSSQQQRTTVREAASENHGNAGSSTRPFQIPHNPLSELPDDNELPDDEEEDSEGDVLPMPARLRTKFKSMRKEAKKQSQQSQEAAHWPRHVFRLMEKDGHWHYDVQGDAISYSGKG